MPRALCSRFSRTRFRCSELIFFCSLLLAAGLEAATSEPLDLEDLFQRPAITGTQPGQIRWSPDGTYLAFTWALPGEGQRSVWLLQRGDDSPRRIELGAQDRPAPRGLVWQVDGEGILLLSGADLWRYNLSTGSAERLHSVGVSASDLALSPDGGRVSFLREGDLWLYDLETKEERALSAIGLPPLSVPPTGRYSRREREVGLGVWGGPTYAWAPDGRHIAIHQVDRRHMRAVAFPNYLAADTDPNLVRRGYPGDANEARRVGLLRVADGDLRLLALDDPVHHQILSISWSAGGDLLIDSASDTATERLIYRLRAGASEPELVWKSERDSRIYTQFAAAWAPNGQDIIVLSDREDFYGLYRLDVARATQALERLDNPDSDVLSAPKVITAGEALFYEDSAGQPAQRQVFRLAEGDRQPVQITGHPGQHQAFPSPDGTALAIIRSDDRNPPELYLWEEGDSAPRRITHSPTATFDKLGLATLRYLQLPATAERPALHLRLMLPADFDETRQYPVLFGPMYSNTVRNRWAGSYALMQQALTQRGYLVVQVDMRGSTGYGRAFREAFLKDFAGGDIEDIAAAAAYLEKFPWIDGDRYGIWGSSYGGTLTVYSLLQKPGLFAAGVAAAAAVDPHFFGTDDVAIVRSPSEAPAIFERRAEALARQLADPLLLVHGFQDQVVPFKTVVSLTDALIRAGKDVETVFLPGATHAWSREPPYDRYVFRRLLEFFDRHLMRANLR